MNGSTANAQSILEYCLLPPYAFAEWHRQYSDQAESNESEQSFSTSCVTLENKRG